jgi:sugar phosphate isomerase/epimerase
MKLTTDESEMEVLVMFTKLRVKHVFIGSIMSIVLLLSACTNKIEQPLMPKISVQLWSVKEAIKSDFEGTLNELAGMGFSGVEFAGEFGKYQQDPKALKSFLDNIGLKVSGAHIPFVKLNSVNFKETTDFYRALGCETLIIPYDARAFDTDQVENLVTDLNRLSVQLAPLGMKIGYHNHAQEFRAHKESTFWDYIAKNTNKNVVMQQDVGWTTYAGKDPIEYVRRYPGRTHTTHYKVELPEGTQGKLPLIGQDTIDWANLIKANIEVGGTRWLVVEQESYPNDLTPLEAVKMSKHGLDSFLKNL